MGQVIFGIDFRSNRAKHLEAFAAEVMTAVFPNGIDGKDRDKPQDEYCAPDKDSA